MPFDEGIRPDGDRLDARLAEAAWDGTLPPEQAPPWYPALAELIAEARGPATPAELAGEDEAVAAVAAMTEQLREGAAGPRRWRVLRLVTVKGVVVGAAVLAGAVAAAAAGVGPTADHLHLPLLGDDRGDERPAPSDRDDRGDGPAEGQGDGAGDAKAGWLPPPGDGQPPDPDEAETGREHHPPGHDDRSDESKGHELKAPEAPKAPKVEKTAQGEKAEQAFQPQQATPTGEHGGAGCPDRPAPHAGPRALGPDPAGPAHGGPKLDDATRPARPVHGGPAPASPVPGRRAPQKT